MHKYGGTVQTLKINDATSKKWDAIIVGAGHNGLTCAAYLAKAGKKVLILEEKEKVGGACTLEETWPEFKVSPCAYVVGLLHSKVIKDLKLYELGLKWKPALGGMFVPFDDGTSLLMHSDDDKCEAEVKKFAPEDVKGWHAMGEVKHRLREALRPDNDCDLWLDPHPTREEIEKRIKGDTDAYKLLFDWSMAEFLDNFLTNEKFKMAYLGQGVIGTKASPFHKGTAYVHFHHVSGRMDGEAGQWGYVIGGMGTVSFYLCEAAIKAGAEVITNACVSEIIPGEGVVLVSGERIFAPVIISNTDPIRTLKLLGKNADSQWTEKVKSVPIEGCTVKVNIALKELPNYKCRPGTFEPHHFAQTNTPLTKTEWKEAFDSAVNGELPKRVWTEIYLQSPVDPTVAPKGFHTMTVFSQYVPHTFKTGNWDTRREEVGDRVVEAISRFCTNMPENILHREVLGPPDVEKKVGLTGGHIFQGEILPEYMWDKRLKYKTPMKGVYLCGAATHPGGSVIAVNGRNAAIVALESNQS